jgi:hypothetical protein
MKGSNCPANQQPHTTYHFYTLQHSYHTPLPLTNTMSFEYYFKDPLWNQDAKDEEDLFFQQEEIEIDLVSQTLSIRLASNLSTGKHPSVGHKLWISLEVSTSL